jgi:hypothetical protein
MKRYFILIFILISIFSLVNSQMDNNEINIFKVNIIDKNILVEVSCSNDLMKVDFNLFDFDNNLLTNTDVFDLDGQKLSNSLDCNINSTQYILKNKNLIEKETYLITVEVMSGGCVSNCNKFEYLYYDKDESVIIPDNNFILIVLIVSFVGFICIKKRI